MARMKPARSRSDPPDRYALGTDAELERRDHNTYKNPATNFQQIRPTDKSGNLNEPPQTNKDGNMKFTSRP